MNGFFRETSKEVICSCRERKKNPPAEEFRHVIAERDGKAVEKKPVVKILCQLCSRDLRNCGNKGTRLEARKKEGK